MTIDVETVKKEIEEKFNAMMDAEGELFKKIEELRDISKDWNPADDEESKTMINLAQNIDGRVIFMMRQMLLRYGNLLFL